MIPQKQQPTTTSVARLPAKTNLTVTAVSIFEATQQNNIIAPNTLNKVREGQSHVSSTFLQSILREWKQQTTKSPLAAHLLKEVKLERAPTNCTLGSWDGIVLIKRHVIQVYKN